MSTYGELVTNALIIIPRPELEPLIRTKLNQLIQYISKSGLFWRDIVEVTIGSSDGVDPATYIQSLTITNAVRNIAYLKYPERVDKIHKLTLEEIATNWEVQNSCCYLSGSLLHIKHVYLTATFDFAYYTSPIIFATDGTDDDESNWITELCPGLLEDMLATYILVLKGEKKDADTISQLSAMMKQTYIRDFVDSVST